MLSTTRITHKTAPVAALAARSLFNGNYPKAYPEHVPLTTLGRAVLAVGSGVATFLDSRRGDLVATLGEATCQPYFIYRLREQMLSDETGRRLLREQPRMTSQSLDLDKLRAMKPGTIGRTYIDWLDKEGVSPDTRAQVRYIDDPECAYVMQRYRESHDFYHALTGLPIIMEGELALKAFEWANTGLPMSGMGMVLTPLKFKPKQRKRYFDIYLPWALYNGFRAKPVINVYWEEVLERDAEELRKELGIEQPPDLRALKKQMAKA